MRILILTDYYPPDKLGGVGQIAESLCEEYEKAGHDVWVLTTGTQQIKQKQIIRSSTNLIKGVFINNIRAIQLIRREDIETVNMHQSSTTLFLLTKHLPFLYRKFPKIVNSFQVSYFSEFKHIRSITVRNKIFKPLTKEYIEKWLFAPMHIFLDLIGYIFADEVTVVSHKNKEEFEHTYGRLSRKQITIIPNGINTNNFTVRKPKLDKQFLDQLKNKTVLLYVGVFRVRKRVFNLLYALEAAIKQNPDTVLVLVGGGRGYEEGILELAKELNLDSKVIFVGRIPNEKVVEYLNAADIFCTLSSYEGMPVAILEAMASSKAILTTSVTGMIDLVEDGKDGYVVAVDDIEATAKRIIDLIGDKEKVKTMGENARNKILSQYQWRQIAARYMELF